MGKHRQKGGDKVDLQVLILITAIINLITAIIQWLQRMKN